MNSDTILNIGIDDTDSPAGMCTTFLAYKIAESLCGATEEEKEDVTGAGIHHNHNYKGTGHLACSVTTDSAAATATATATDDATSAAGATPHGPTDTEFLDYPRLVRLNPNIPWKTRGNGAVSMRIKTSEPQRVKDIIKNHVFGYSDTEHGANPGLVFLEGGSIPSALTKFGRTALWQLISRSTAREVAAQNGLEYHFEGNGQGLVGAISAIGYDWTDHTMELLSYRKPPMFGTPRIISAASVRAMHNKTSPETFNSFDECKNRIMIAPHGPDPVFYGIRGENADLLVRAADMLHSSESPHGYMIFRTNQGTGDHLKNELTFNTAKPYASGWMMGSVSSAPQIGRGGHILFDVAVSGVRGPPTTHCCAVYKPTGITGIAMGMIPGDTVHIGGGIRRASKNHPRVLNVEYIEIIKLAKSTYLANPACTTCKKRMKSKGRGQGFMCARGCNRAVSAAKEVCEKPRDIKKGMYIPRISAHRHLTRPKHRLGRRNRGTGFDGDLPWLRIYKNSGE